MTLHAKVKAIVLETSPMMKVPMAVFEHELALIALVHPKAIIHTDRMDAGTLETLRHGALVPVDPVQERERLEQKYGRDPISGHLNAYIAFGPAPLCSLHKHLVEVKPEAESEAEAKPAGKVAAKVGKVADVALAA